MQSSSRQHLQSIDDLAGPLPLVEDEHVNRPLEGEGAWKAVQGLATLLLGFNPAAAFKPDVLGTSSYSVPRSTIQGHRLPGPATMILSGVAEPLESTGKSVAEWCMSSDQAQATIAVSRGTTTAHVLRDLFMMARRFADEPKGAVRVIAFPRWKEGEDPKVMEDLLQHIEQCTSVCQYLGDEIYLVGRHHAMRPSEDEPMRPPCPMLVLRSNKQNWNEDFGDDDPFAHLPDDDFAPQQTEDNVQSDEEILAQTKKWVEAVIVKMKVCPFSSTADKAGIPIGGVSYPITHATTGEEVYEEFWNQVLGLRNTDEKSRSTVLLLTPDFMQYAAGGYDVLADTLNSGLTLLGFEKEVQLVFFHPEYTFRDGQDRMGEGAAANYARRSPYPMINLLRTPQVRDAQKGIPTGAVYITNEKNLKIVGKEELENMLRKRDWTDIYGHKFVPHKDVLV